MPQRPSNLRTPFEHCRVVTPQEHPIYDLLSGLSVLSFCYCTTDEIMEESRCAVAAFFSRYCMEASEAGRVFF